MKRTRCFTFLVVITLAAGTIALAQEQPPILKLDDFLANLASDNANLRLEARLAAAPFGAPAVAPLAKLMLHQSPEVVVAAREALERIVHHAGRPGAEAERPAVIAEMEKLLSPDQPVAVKREAVHLLGFIAGDGSVPVVVKLLDDADPNVKETARLALERIPGETAVKALSEALKRASDERKPPFLYSLSKKGGNTAIAVLAEHAKGGTIEARLTALEGLARLGVVASVELFNAALEDPKGMSKERLYSEHLRLADQFKSKGDKAAALAIYRRALTEAPQEYLREHALYGACSGGEAGHTDLLITALGDSGKKVRSLSMSLLMELQSPEVMVLLRKAYAAAPKDLQPALLVAMAERDRSKAAEVIEQASKSASLDLKITALDLLGQLNNPELAPAYLEVAEKGLELAKPIAIKGYLQVAKGRFDGGDKERSFAMYEKVLQLASATNEQRLEALRGAITTGHPQAISLSSGYLKDSILATDAAKGVIQLAAKLEAPQAKETAEKFLTPLLASNYTEEIRNQAVAQLRRFGIDPQSPAKSQGYLVNWWISTPIQDADRTGFDQKFYPEEQIEKNAPIDFEGFFLIGPRRVRWRKIEGLSSDGRIDLDSLFRRSENVLVYAYTEVTVPGDQEVVFRMGSDDGIGCWLNGKRVHANNILRKYLADEDAIRVRLQAGVNRLLIKVTQKTDEWCFCLRLLDKDKNPLDLRALEKK